MCHQHMQPRSNCRYVGRVTHERWATAIHFAVGAITVDDNRFRGMLGEGIGKLSTRSVSNPELDGRLPQSIAAYAGLATLRMGNKWLAPSRTRSSNADQLSNGMDDDLVHVSCWFHSLGPFIRWTESGCQVVHRHPIKPKT